MLTELRLRPWWRAPLLLWRRPGVLVALVAAAFVATLPAASAPLFLSSSQSASIARQVDSFPPAYSGVRVAASLNFTPDEEAGVIRAVAANRAEHARRAAAGVPNLGPLRVSFVAGGSFFSRDVGGAVRVTNVDGRGQSPGRDVLLLAREGFADEVETVEGRSGGGAWLPDVIANDLGISAGDRVELGFRGESVEIPVAAVHRDLRRGTLSPFWSSVRTVVQTPDIQAAQPAAVLVDGRTFQEIAQSLHLFADHMVEFPLADPTPSRELAGEAAEALPGMRADLFSREAQAYYYGGSGVTFSSELPRFVERSDLVASTLRVPVAAASVAGAAVGLLVVGAAALLWTRRRHRELVVLAANGAGPGRSGSRAGWRRCRRWCWGRRPAGWSGTG